MTPPRKPARGETPRPLIELQDIRKSYGGREGEGGAEGGSPAVTVLHGISLQLHAGEFVAIVGASGSGKSTLMHILGCLDRASAGRYLFDGRDVSTFDGDALAWLRREAFGFVFQGYHLVPANRCWRTRRFPRSMPECRKPSGIRVPLPCSNGWAWARGCTTARTSSRAASSSAWPSRVR